MLYLRAHLLIRVIAELLSGSCRRLCTSVTERRIELDAAGAIGAPAMRAFVRLWHDCNDRDAGSSLYRLDHKQVTVSAVAQVPHDVFVPRHRVQVVGRCDVPDNLEGLPSRKQVAALDLFRDRSA